MEKLMKKLYEGEMVRIVDVHKEDARYHLRDIMKGMIVKCVLQHDNNEVWFSGHTTIYQSQWEKMYDERAQEYNIMCHFKIKVERLY